MKKISILLVILILISLLPTKSFAISSEQEFFNYLDSIGVERETENGNVANYLRYKKYNLIVYGSPWGDEKKYSIDPNISGPQKRYLGYTLQDKSYENPAFPPDSSTGTSYENFNYIKLAGAVPSWESIGIKSKGEC